MMIILVLTLLFVTMYHVLKKGWHHWRTGRSIGYERIPSQVSLLSLFIFLYLLPLTYRMLLIFKSLGEIETVCNLPNQFDQFVILTHMHMNILQLI